MPASGRYQANVKTVHFKKHSYGRERKRSQKIMEDFDPRPAEYHNTAKNLLHDFLGKVKGKGLGVSLLLDPNLRANSSGMSSLQPELPSKAELQYRVREFKKSLELPPEKTREIEQNTRDQHNSPLWFSVRRYRLTASHFGAIYCRSDMPPQALVLQILGTKQVTAPALEWGQAHKEVALQQYEGHQHLAGHTRLFRCRSGFIVSDEHPFFGSLT